MEKANHLLAAYDDRGNYRPLGEPESYDSANAKLKEGVAVAAGEKVALISLRAGVRKRRPGVAKKAAKKKAASNA